MGRIKKRGVFFSTDALVAILTIFLVILILVPTINRQKFESNLDQDLLLTLSTLKMAEIENSYVQFLISQELVPNVNNSVLEQIGEYYITNRTLAKNLAQEILNELETKENLGIWFESTLIASKNNTPLENARQIETSRQIISGIQSGQNITGFSARAFLSSSLQKKYYYFGGYIGDGNISAIVEYNGNISSAELEIAINKNFDLHINDNFIDSYVSSENAFTPQNYIIPIGNFSSGENKIEIRGDNLNIAGGFLKITYDNFGEYSQSSKQNLPGVKGIINIYDGLTIPGTLQTLNINLRLNTNKSVYFNIGNTTIFDSPTSGEEIISIPNSELTNLLNYNSLSEKTTPIRIGLKNVSYIVNGTREADIFSVTDLSGSMEDTCNGGGLFCCLFNGWCSTQNTCNSCGGVWEERLGLAKEANHILVESILNNSGNRLGLSGYKDLAYDSDYHNLSTNKPSLDNKINQWTAGGNTCICCGINKAINGFSISEPDKLKAMIVMSDGIANVRCSEQGTGNAKTDAIQAACQAKQNHNITVHAVGFGSDADEQTLQSIATCGNGSYYFAEINELTSLYQEIARDIIEGTYIEQTIALEGDLLTQIHPDSYIEFQHSQNLTPFGLIITSEVQFINSTIGYFEIPENSTVIEARAISYSGARWTDKVKLNSNLIYDLNSYGNNFTELGDPYSIRLPNSLISQNNTLEITTASSAGNSTIGSQYNKIIYTLLKQVSGFSSIVSIAEGCIWHITFEDNSNITLPIPNYYSGTNNCYYTPTNLQYDSNDAAQTAVFNLLRELDINLNNRIDIQFTDQDLEIDLSEITGIPFPWSTEVQIRKWI